MKKIFIVVLVVVLSFGVHILIAQTQSGSNPRIERWEYTSLTTFESGHLNAEQMILRANQLGHEGWELVMIDRNSYPNWIFKRRLP